ncbi:MAG TPA: endonuclease/exonuclease/phosphatase family protein [Thermoanaerobaculia bacterium]|nr:endonuclease/exonuclease/phosphatase family protein [Thermoanaerobaculia bacterium]
MIARALAVLLLLAGCASWPTGETPLNVMTFNIRLNLASDGPNAWPHRKELVARMISSQKADLVGLQEALPEQLEDLATLLPDYARFGDGRSAVRGGEFCAILYRKTRFEVLEHDTFWLSETPSVAGSKGWDGAHERILTWGRMRDRRTGQLFFHFNTHLDHVGKVARREGALLIVSRVADIAGNAPAILTGDFNDLPDSEPYRIIRRAGFHDALEISRTPHRGPMSSWNAFKAIEPGRRIDFVFVRGEVDVLRHTILPDTFGGRFPSDHLPVVAKVVLKDEG